MRWGEVRLSGWLVRIRTRKIAVQVRDRNLHITNRRIRLRFIYSEMESFTLDKVVMTVFKWKSLLQGLIMYNFHRKINKIKKKINYCNLRQVSLASSEPSKQSFELSQIQSNRIHDPFVHWNSLDWHCWTCGQSVFFLVERHEEYFCWKLKIDKDFINSN